MALIQHLARAPSRVKDRNSRRPTRFDAIHTLVDLPSNPLSSTIRPMPPAKTPPDVPVPSRELPRQSFQVSVCWYRIHLPTDRLSDRENRETLITPSTTTSGGTRAGAASRVARVVRLGVSREPSSSRTSPSRSGRSAAPARVRGFGSSLPAPRQRFILETSRRVVSSWWRFATWAASTPSPRSPPRLRRTPTASAARDTP